MVATRNKRKSSSPAASPATATRSSKRGKAAAEDPPAEDDPAAVAVEPETTNSSSKSAPTATDADDVEVAATTTKDDVEANDSVAVKSGGESEEVAADGIADVKVVPAETPTTDQPQQHEAEDDDCDAEASNNDKKAEADEVDASAAAAAEEVVADVKKEEEGKKEESNVGVGDSATDHSHQQAADVAYVIDTSPHVAATAAVDVVAKKEEKKEPTSTNAATASINDKVNKSNADKNADATSSKAPSSATTAPTTSKTNPTTTTTTASSSSSTPILEETDQLLPLHVGRVIGKGGEMIRDLQARSGCLRIDVDQNVPQNAPRIISYRGTRSAIDFAKQLVIMLCKTEQGKEANLPLGHAVTKTVHVPSNVIGKIIGRGGEMIRKLQGESMAKIQVDHTTTTPSGDRLITITGVQESVARAEEMIQFVCANPALDSMQGLDMFLREKAQAQYQQQYYPGGGGGGYPPFSHQQQLPPYPQGQFGGGGGGGGYPGAPPAAGPQFNNPSMVETDMFPCAKTYMGRVIGQKGVTINDLQKRSGCDIQINQNVPAGQDCQISIKGSRSGIEMAKQMLREIIEMGPNHPYAGGHGHVGGGGSFGPPGGGGGGFGGGGGYQQPYQAYPQQFPGYPNDNYPPQGHPSHRPQQPFGNVPPHLQQQQQQPYGQQPYLLTPQHLQQQQQQPPTYQQPDNMAASPWRAASAPDGQIYYYNSITQETQWDRPAGMP